MTRYLKQIGLLSGIALVFVSFLFFGRQQGTYQILIISGLVIALVFSLSILLHKRDWKAKVACLAIVVFSALLLHLTEPFIIDQSYCIFIKENGDVLKGIDSLLMQKQGDISVSYDTVISKGEQLNAEEIRKLKEGREKLGVYLIARQDKGIYYGLWGFLDVRLGITYLPGADESNKEYRHLTGNWFR